MRQAPVGPEAARPRGVVVANPRAASGIPPRGTEHVSLHEQRSAPRAPPPRCIEVRVLDSRAASRIFIATPRANKKCLGILIITHGRLITPVQIFFY